MTQFIDIKPGQWVLAFSDPYAPHDREMPEHLEMFSRRGGGWDSHRVTEIFHVFEVIDIKPERHHPKTYTIGEAVPPRRSFVRDRQYRGNVIAAGTKDKIIGLRDRLFAVGSEADDVIEAEMYRRIERFAARERGNAVKKIHRLLPQFFRRDA